MIKKVMVGLPFLRRQSPGLTGLCLLLSTFRAGADDGSYTFVPYGSHPKPESAKSFDAEFAFRLPDSVTSVNLDAVRQRLSSVGVTLVGAYELENSASTLVVARLDDQRDLELPHDYQRCKSVTDAVSRLEGGFFDEGVLRDPESTLEALPIDAGPFATADDAAHFVKRWLLEFWECHRSEFEPDAEKLDNIYQSGNSCHEWGGCHRRCWWRGEAGRVALGALTELSVGAAPGGPHIEFLRSRAANDAREVDEPAEVKLQAFVLSPTANMHYAALRPMSSADDEAWDELYI